MKKPLIGFVGMTHLGLVSSVAAAEKEFDVICFDPNESLVTQLKLVNLTIKEPKLDELIIKNQERIHFTSNSDDLYQCDLVYIAPDVSTDDSGKSDLTLINILLDQVFLATKKDAICVILSQVPPGFTRAKNNNTRILFYQVETLIFGRAIDRALFPERYIIGCEYPSNSLPLNYKMFLEAHHCPILQMRYESAELAKISINACLVASITTANTLAELCEQIGADWSEIVSALKLDKRIGEFAYLTPGLGISGGNLERDLATICNFADKYKTDATVVRAWLKNSHRRKSWPVNILYKNIVNSSNKDLIVAIWGLAYKENTHSIKNSPSLVAISQLQNVKINVYDPVVKWNKKWHPNATHSPTALEALNKADVLLIMTPWPEFKNWTAKEIFKKLNHQLIIDPYNLLSSANDQDVKGVYILGKKT